MFACLAVEVTEMCTERHKPVFVCRWTSQRPCPGLPTGVFSCLSLLALLPPPAAHQAHLVACLLYLWLRAAALIEGNGFSGNPISAHVGAQVSGSGAAMAQDSFSPPSVLGSQTVGSEV